MLSSSFFVVVVVFAAFSRLHCLRRRRRRVLAYRHTGHHHRRPLLGRSRLRVVPPDAGIHVKSLRPKCVLLTHGHRDHTAALPALAAGGAKVLAPAPIAPLVRRFLLAEAQLNFGDAAQTDAETVAALGAFDVAAVADGEAILLPRRCYSGSPTPIGVQVLIKQEIPSPARSIAIAPRRVEQTNAPPTGPSVVRSSR